MEKNRLVKELINAIVVGTGIYFVFLAIYFFIGRFDDGFDFVMAWREYYNTIIFTLILYMANSIWMYYLLDAWGFKLFTFKRLTLGMLGNLVISLAGIFVARFIMRVLLSDISVQDFFYGERLSYYRVSLLISVVVSAIFYAVFYYKSRQEKKVKEQKIIAGTASARFDALKNQLDPHFLFNSLNVLTSLIEEDPRQAQKFTTSLSKVYRYVLEQKNKDLVTVDEELRFARTYVHLLKMRFEDSIVFDIPESATNPEAKIVPLSLQLLLENAVKHNVVTASRPLKIRVFEENGTLKVTNNLQEKQVVKKSSGVGLQNIRQRYAILTEKAVNIEKTRSDFVVQLPMLSKRVSVVESQESHIEEKRYQKAKERVEAIKGFYGNLTAYVVGISIIWWINLRTTDFLWAVFPTLGWGFGVFAHGMEAFGYNPLWGKRWEERKIQEFMDQEDF